MAILEKHRARKPLAENRMSQSWSNYRANGEGERYNITVSSEYDDAGKSNIYSMKLTPLEALSFATQYARHATFDNSCGTVDRRPAHEAFRALADQLEVENRD